VVNRGEVKQTNKKTFKKNCYAGFSLHFGFQKFKKMPDILFADKLI
jgi:hypothetical protein